MLCLRKKSRLISLIILVCFLSGCQYQTSEPIEKSDKERIEPLPITRFDRDVEWKDGTEINLTQETESVVIRDGGDYRIYGKSEQGIIINAEDQNVHLFLDNVDIHTTYGTAIHVSSAGKVVITLMDGSVNLLSDYPSAANEENVDAVIFSVTDLTINGSGRLELAGYHKDGIYTKDVLKILDGDYVIRAKGNGIRGSDGVILSPAIMSIESEKNGVLSSNVGKAGKGSIDIAGGEIDIISGEKGICAAADLVIRDSKISCQGILENIAVEGNRYIDETCLQ